MTTNELFIGHFTGTLTTFTTKDNRRVSFKKPYPRIERGAPYNVQIDTGTGRVRLLPIIPPPLGGVS